MPYEAGNRGISVSRLYAIRDLIRADIDGLNDAFAAEALLEHMTSLPFSSSEVLEAHVSVGLIRQQWNPVGSTDLGQGGPIRICVCISDNQRGLDFEASQSYIERTPTGGVVLVLHTSIMVYIHPNVLSTQNASLRSEREEMACSTISDWLRWVLNKPENQTIQLTSQEYHPTDATPGADADKLKRCLAGVGFLGRFGVGFGAEGGEQIIGMHFLHRSEIG